MTRKQEDFQNRALALLLAEQGVTTDFERREGRKRMDIVAQVDGLRIVLEAETGFHRKAQAVKDADARLRQELTTVVFAVCYPDGVTEENLADATLTWTLRVKAGEPPGEWASGGVAQLAQAVQQAPRSLSGADVAAQKLSDGLDQVAQRLKTLTRRALAQALDLPATPSFPRKRESSGKDDGYFVAAKRGNAGRRHRDAVSSSRAGLPTGGTSQRLRRGLAACHGQRLRRAERGHQCLP